MWQTTSRLASYFKFPTLRENRTWIWSHVRVRVQFINQLVYLITMSPIPKLAKGSMTYEKYWQNWVSESEAFLASCILGKNPTVVHNLTMQNMTYNCFKKIGIFFFSKKQSKLCKNITDLTGH